MIGKPPIRGEVDRGIVARYCGDVSALGGVRSMVLDDGAGRGVRCLEFRTGAGLAFDVLVDRGMDIGAAEWRGDRFGWTSPVEIRSPALHEPEGEHGLGWLRSFTGLLQTCGLDHTLFMASVDASNYNYQPRPTTWNALHGRVANTPARLTGYGETWIADDRCLLWCEGEVRQAANFGEHLRLRRRVEAELGGNTLTIDDVVTNHGFEPTPHMFMYHVNVGWPFLEVGAEIELGRYETVWKNEAAAASEIDDLTVSDPTDSVHERVYSHRHMPTSDGVIEVGLTRPSHRQRFVLRYRREEFPHFFQWMNLRSGAYAVGLEPSTHAVEGSQAARDDGSMIWLGPGESRSYRTSISIDDEGSSRP